MWPRRKFGATIEEEARTMSLDAIDAMFRQRFYKDIIKPEMRAGMKQAFREGFQQGRNEGARHAVKRMLEIRFGSLSAPA